LSSGGSADDVTPSAATGAAFEPLRSLQRFAVFSIPSSPASGMAGDRGGRSGGRDETWAQRREWTDRQFVQRARSGAAGRKPDRDPRARDRAAATCAAGEQRPWSALPRARAQRADRQKKTGWSCTRFS